MTPIFTNFFKRTIVVLFLFCFCIPLNAKKVNVEEAIFVAQYLVEQQFNMPAKSGELVLAYTAINAKSPESPVYYVFNVGEDHGFVIISGDDMARPILGYTTQGKYEHENLPTNFEAWMKDVFNVISEGINSNIKATTEIREEWDAYFHKKIDYFSKGSKAINALITTTWNQDAPYNNQCPLRNGSRCLTGCVATAMAQMMKYYNHPAQGTGSSSAYYTSTFNIYVPSVSFTVNYNFNTMGGATPTTTTEQANVAQLMYHCGVSVQMDYGLSADGGSAASSSNVRAVMVNNFGYDNSMTYRYRSSYNDTQWMNLLKQELDASRPVYHRGSNSSGGGHAFICDGYNDQNLFHFNWGWGGYSNGYYAVNPMSGDFFPIDQAIYTNWKPYSTCNPVTNLAVNYTTDCKANLTWTAPGGSVTYNVYRDNVQIATNLTTTSYTDLNPNSAVGHTWSVRAVCTSGESNPLSVSKPACQQGNTAFGYIHWPVSDIGYWKWDVNNVSGKTLIKSNMPTLYGGTYFDNKLYAYETIKDNDDNLLTCTFYIIDAATGNTLNSIVKSSLYGSVVSALAYDYTNNTMYALRNNTLSTVNLTNGDLTTVATITGFSPSSATLLTLAIHLNGTMYTVNSGNANLYKVNKTTGAVTLVGSTGRNVGYAQSMAFDHSDGTLYWCESESVDDNFMTLNTTTGAATMKQANTYETTCLHFPYTPSQPNTVTISTNVSPTGSGTVTGGGIYTVGQSVTLTASANSGYVFQKWNDNVTTNPRTFTATVNATYTAIFQATTPGCNPATNLAVNYTTDCKANLTWNAPAGKRDETRAVLWDNTDINSQNYGQISAWWTGGGNGRILADDFDVTANWSIEKITTKAFYGQYASGPVTMGVKIFANNSGVPGTEIYSNIALPISASSNIYTITLPTPFQISQSGKYWIAIFGVYNTATPTSQAELDQRNFYIYYGGNAIGVQLKAKDYSSLFGGYDWKNLDEGTSGGPIISMYFKIEGTSTTPGTVLYNVYRDGSLIAPNITTTSYTDQSFSTSVGHTWSVKVVCPSGESEAVNATKPACVIEVAPTITTTTLPGGVTGTAYSQQLAATGTTPITWSLASGNLPTGLTLSSAGVISGTPTAANTFNFTVKATNSAGNNTKALSIVITAATVAPTITTTTLPDGVTGTAYNQQLAATGSAPITWSLASGNLPTGLTIYSGGTISGTPIAAGTFNFTVQATNSAGSETKPLSIFIEGVGVSENELSGITVYPNPTTGQLTIDNGDLMIDNVVIFDVYGRILKAEDRKRKGEGTIVMDISELSRGIYFMKIYTEKGEVIRKVVKE